jgi:hypothetical protein
MDLMRAALWASAEDDATGVKENFLKACTLHKRNALISTQ